MKLRRMMLTAAGLSTLVAAACDQSADPAGITEAALAPAFAFTAPTIAVGELWVCKEGPAGTYDFTLSAAVSGTIHPTAAVTNGAFSVDAGTCVKVVDNFLGGNMYDGGSVNVTEDVGSLPANVQFESVQRYHFQGSGAGGDSGTPVAEGPSSTNPTAFSSGVGNDNGQLLLYTNVAIPTIACTYTQGYWKNHAAAWPVTSLDLGTVTYDQTQLLSILNAPVQGNGLISLAHQLIAAKLNGATSSTPGIGASIAAADALIGSLVVPPVGSDYLDPSATSSLTDALDDFNSGITGPGHCGD